MTQLETPAKTPKTPKRSGQRAKIEAALKLQREAKTEFKSKEFVSDPESEPEQTIQPQKENAEPIEEAAEEVDEPIEEPIEEAEEAEPIEKVDEPLWKKNAAFLSAYLLRRTDRKQGTHSLLVRGRYSVPLEKRSTFYKKYFDEFVRWLNSPTSEPSLFLTERYNREYFRFFVDLDYEWSDKPPNYLRTIKHLTESVTSMVSYMDESLYAQDPLEVRPSERTNYKRHVVFPQVIVDHTKALLFAQTVEKYINNQHESDTITFDMKVYGKGSLRMLGSAKNPRLVPEDDKETEFVYMPIDLTTGERKKTITYEEFARHTILLDKETTERIEKFAAADDGLVCLPPDERYSSALYVIPKYIHKDVSGVVQTPRVYEESTYTGPCEVSDNSPLHRCVRELFGAEVANGTGVIDHDPKWNSLRIAVDKTTFCPLAGREHKSNHAYITLSKRGIRMMCYSTNEPACRNGGAWTPLKDLPKEVVELLPNVPETPEITEDICGGGESDEETAVEQPRKTKSKKRRAPRAKRGNHPVEPLDSDVLEKGVLIGLYNEKNGAHEQPSFTAYLNDFVTYVHANDSYGFRHNRNLPFALGKKSTVANKLERYNSDFDAFSIWCRNDNRREFHQCVFDTSPKIYGPGVLNLFKGYKARLLDEEVSIESVEVFLYHIREIYCTGNDRDYKFFLFWWAWVFQMGRTGVMVILMSLEKGTGKNILLELIAEHIIGDQYVATTDKITTITQKFNALNAEKVLVIANELKDATKSKKEQKGTVEVLKTLIKDRTMTIEKKGVDPLHGIPSTTNYIGTSNNVTPVKIDPDQRRFFALKVSDAKKGDSEYFNTLSEFVKENADRIYTFLMRVDLTGWAPEKDMPQTEYVKEIQAAFRNPIYLFWDDSDWIKHDFNALPTNSEKIFDQYVGWCEKMRIPGTPAFPWFGRLVREMGYTVNRETRYGERAQWISGNMSENARKLATAN